MTAHRRLITGMAANFIGQGINAAASFAFIPAYIRLLGIEAYGLIGVFTVVLTAATLLDAGMTPTLNREMASFKAGQRDASEMRDLLISAFLIGIGVVAAAGAISVLLAPLLARIWLPPSSLEPTVVTRSLALMGVVAALRIVEGLLRGVLLGLQRPVFMNIVSSATVLLRAGGVLIPLSIHPSISVFFVWQAIVCLVGIVVLGVVALRTIGPAAGRPRFAGQALMRVRGFAGGVFATSIIALVLGQADKVLLVKLTSLQTFGYYAIGVAVSAVLYQGVLPIAQSYYPHFTIEYANRREAELAVSYHQASQMVAVLIAAGASFIVVFGYPLLLSWSGKADVAANVAPVLRVLVLAASLHCLMYIPYMLQLAAGWSRLAVIVNSAMACLYLPLLWWAASRYGAIGAALALGTNNLAALVVTTLAMHRRLLPGEWLRWLLRDVVPPALAAALTAGLLHLLLPPVAAPFVRLVMLGFVGLMILLAAAFAASDLRELVKRRFGRAHLSRTDRSGIVG